MMFVRFKGDGPDPHGKFKEVAVREKRPGNIPAEIMSNLFWDVVEGETN